MDRDALARRLKADPQISQLIEALRGVPGCWLVGGAVRDLLLGQVPVDLDVAVEGNAVSAARAAAAALDDAELITHERFGTATVATDDLMFDLAATRSERYSRPGALPVVAPATLDADLPRRDVTVNALAIALSPEDLGELKAARNALEDLAARRLRVFHAKSFVDDPTRLLRLARYAGRLGFTIEETTERLARAAVASDALATVSGTRVGSELLAIAGEQDPSACLLVARDLGLLENLHAGLRVDAAAIARGRELARGSGDADPAIVVLALVGGGLERSELRWWLDHVGLPATAREATVAGASRAAELGQALAAARRPSEIGAAVREERPESVATAGALDERATDSARRWLSELRSVRLEINGDDLVAEGIPRGPRVAVGLDAALAARLDGIVRDRGGELRTALSAANAGS